MITTKSVRLARMVWRGLLALGMALAPFGVTLAAVNTTNTRGLYDYLTWGWGAVLFLVYVRQVLMEYRNSWPKESSNESKG